MINEEMQRTMQFILEQQAQFAASMQRLDEERRRDAEERRLYAEERRRDAPRMQKLEESFQLLVQLAAIANSRQETTDVRLDILEKGEVTLQANMAALAVAQAHADERLSALADIVREDRNGKS